jgi:hypothetical protein
VRSPRPPGSATPIEKIVVHRVSVEVPPLGDVATKARSITNDREDAAKAAAVAQAKAARYAKELVAANVPVRDVAELLGLSFQRVSQLVTEAQA